MIYSMQEVYKSDLKKAEQQLPNMIKHLGETSVMVVRHKEKINDLKKLIRKSSQ